jgi:hypothetical protein
MGQKIRDKKRIEVTTNGNNTVTAYTLTTTSNTSIRIGAKLLGRRNSNTDTYCRIEERCYKNVSGTVSQVGTTATLFSVSNPSLNSSNLNFNITGTNIAISVTGANEAQLVDWELELEIDIN